MTQGYGFTKRSAQRIGRVVRTVEHTTRTTPANHSKRRRTGFNCYSVKRAFVPGPYDYTPGADVVAVVPKWNVEDVGGTRTVTTCGYEEVKECPAAALLQTVFDTEADLVAAHDPVDFPSGTQFYVVDDTDPDNRVSDVYLVQGPEGGSGESLIRVGGLTPLEEEQLALWGVMMR